MSTDTVAERSLYRDLAEIMSSMREERLRDVEAALEARIRDYIKVAPPDAIGLEMAMGWLLPCGADAWPVYTTRFRTMTTQDWRQDEVATTTGTAADLLPAEAIVSTDEGHEPAPEPAASRRGELIPMAACRRPQRHLARGGAVVLPFPHG